MIDRAELKRLAEASRVANHDELGPDEAFQEALHPEVVLALIAENEAYASRLHEVATICATAEQERDQLKAENAGLRTGYQAYERVNAGLKAEVESLRKEAERYRFLRNGPDGLDLSSADTMEEVDALIDAAMGKGEQP